MLFRHMESKNDPGQDIAMMLSTMEARNGDVLVMKVKSNELSPSWFRFRLNRLRKW